MQRVICHSYTWLREVARGFICAVMEGKKRFYLNFHFYNVDMYFRLLWDCYIWRPTHQSPYCIVAIHNSLLQSLRLYFVFLCSNGYIIWSYWAWKDSSGSYLSWCKINIRYSQDPWIFGSHSFISVVFWKGTLLSHSEISTTNFVITYAGNSGSMCRCL